MHLGLAGAVWTSIRLRFAFQAVLPSATNLDPARSKASQARLDLTGSSGRLSRGSSIFRSTYLSPRKSRRPVQVGEPVCVPDELLPSMVLCATDDSAPYFVPDPLAASRAIAGVLSLPRGQWLARSQATKPDRTRTRENLSVPFLSNRDVA